MLPLRANEMIKCFQIWRLKSLTPLDTDGYKVCLHDAIMFCMNAFIHSLQTFI